MTEQDRVSYPQTGDRKVANAYQEREQRLASDIAAMQAGPTEHAANMTSYHQGAPSVQQQMTSHGAPAPGHPTRAGTTQPATRSVSR
jgi:hypothetical protein